MLSKFFYSIFALTLIELFLIFMDNIFKLIIFFSILIFSSFDIPSNDDSENYYIDEMLFINEQVDEIFNDISTYKTDEITTVFRYEIVKFSKFISHQNQFQNQELALEILINQFIDLSQNFQKITYMCDDIKLNLENNLNYFDSLIYYNSDIVSDLQIFSDSIIDEINTLDSLILIAQSDSLSLFLSEKKQIFAQELADINSTKTSFEQKLDNLEILRVEFCSFIGAFNSFSNSINHISIIYDDACLNYYSSPNDFMLDELLATDDDILIIIDFVDTYKILFDTYNELF